MERSEYSYNILQIHYRNIDLESIAFDPLVESLIGHFLQLSLCIARYLRTRTFVELGMSTRGVRRVVKWHSEYLSRIVELRLIRLWRRVGEERYLAYRPRFYAPMNAYPPYFARPLKKCQREEQSNCKWIMTAYCVNDIATSNISESFLFIDSGS